MPRPEKREMQEQRPGTGDVLKVGTHSDPQKVAGTIAQCVRERPDRKVEIQTIGAGALNQAIKAIAIARGYLAPGGVDIRCYPAFVDVEIEGAERTAIKLFVEPK